MAPLKHILMVDDSKTDRMIHRRWLEREDFLITEATTAEQGIELAIAEPFDCILMDYVLPDGDGLYAIRMLRAALPLCPPVILLSASLMPEMRANAMALGAAECVQKPVSDGVFLVAAIKAAMHRHETAIDALTEGVLQ